MQIHYNKTLAYSNNLNTLVSLSIFLVFLESKAL